MKCSLIAILLFSQVSLADELNDIFNATESILVSKCEQDPGVCSDISRSDVAMVETLNIHDNDNEVKF